MHNYYVPLTTNNEMSVRDIVNECHTGNWSPVLVIQYEDGRVVVPVFNSHDTAMKFIFRNFDKKLVKATSGTIGLDEEDFDLFTNKGWEIEILNFPRKFKDRKDASLVVEVFEIPQGFQMPNQGMWD